MTGAFLFLVVHKVFGWRKATGERMYYPLFNRSFVGVAEIAVGDGKRDLGHADKLEVAVDRLAGGVVLLGGFLGASGAEDFGVWHNC